MLTSGRHRNCLRYVSVAVFSFTLTGCGQLETPPGKNSESNQPAKLDETSWIRDITSDSGLDFEHQVGDFSKYEMPSIMGSGCGVADYDGDGRPDFYFVNGMNSDRDSIASQIDRKDGFYRQRADGRFQEIASLTGIQATEFGMGAWWGDLDADGFPDLFLTNVGSNRLFQNQGDGTFRRISLPSGVAEQSWSTAACWVDLNADSHLDLVVVNYVDYLPGQHCEGADGRREFCGPSTYAGTVDRLLINAGQLNADADAPFRDETVERGLGDQLGKGLGILARDFNADGTVDLYIANDMQENYLWLQQPDGAFREQAERSGLARNFLGDVEASMGMVMGDWNRDGLPDILITHLSGETNTIYLSVTEGLWRDASSMTRLGGPSLPHTGFGIAAADLELDGDLDFLVVNGAVKRVSSASKHEHPHDSYAQRNALYLRDADELLFDSDVTIGGEFTGKSEISRALATTDFDRDGDLDFLLTNCAGPARLYENVAPRAGHWLEVRLIDTVGNREAIGVQVKVHLEPGNWVERDQNPYQGYLTSNEPLLHFGLGQRTSYQSLEVEWPDGTLEIFPGGAADTRFVLVRNSGIFSDHPDQPSPVRSSAASLEFKSTEDAP